MTIAHNHDQAPDAVESGPPLDGVAEAFNTGYDTGYETGRRVGAALAGASAKKALGDMAASVKRKQNRIKTLTRRLNRARAERDQAVGTLRQVRRIVAAWESEPHANPKWGGSAAAMQRVSDQVAHFYSTREVDD